MFSSHSKHLKIFGGTVLLLILLGWVLSRSGISLEKATQALTAFRAPVLLASCAFCVAQVLGMILRTKFLFTNRLDPGFRTVAYAISIGQGVNTFLPARAGDVIKAVLFSRAATGPIKPTLLQGAGVLLADRIVDISSLILLVVLSGAYRMPGVTLPSLPSIDGGGIGVAAALIVVIAVAVWLLRKKLSTARRWLYEMRAGLAGMLDPKRVTLSVLFAMAAWAAEALSLQVLANAQGLGISFSQSMYLLVILNLAIAVPVSVANVGAFEASIIFALGTLGASMEQGLAVATVHHAMQWAAISAWALSMMWLFRGKVSWRETVSPLH